MLPAERNSRPGVIIEYGVSSARAREQHVRSLGVAYTVLSPQESDLDLSFSLEQQLPALRVRVLEACSQVYKERAKAVRRHVRSQTDHKRLVRGNFVAGLLEEAAGDLEAAAKAFHVALSAIVEAAKSSPNPKLFIEDVSEASDALAIHVVSCLARNGEAEDATAYLRAHLNWAGAPPDRRAALYLSVADAFTKRLDTGLWCLRAVELMRGQSPIPVPQLREALTRAFDAFTEAGGCIRHLVYLSMISARLFQAQDNLVMLAQTLIESGWPHLARLLLVGVPLPEKNPTALWLLSDSDEEASELLEVAPGTLIFKNVLDTALFSSAVRFTAEGHLELGFCNMSPVVFTITRVEVNLSLPDSERTVSVDMNEELVPGAYAFHSHSIEGEFIAKISSLRVITSTGLQLVYYPSALADIGTLYSIPLEDTRWNRAFLRALFSFTERSRVRRLSQQIKSVASQVSCLLKSSLTATGCPVSFGFSSNIADVQIVLVSADHGTSDELMRPVAVDETVHITWSSPGQKTVAFEIRQSGGTPLGTITETLHVLNPLSIQFTSQYLDSSLLLVADIEVQLDSLQLMKWELWDSGTGSNYPCLFSAKTPSCYMKGDVLRVAFVLDDPSTASPLLRVTWSCEGSRACATEECPPGLLVPPVTLQLWAQPSSSRMAVGDCVNVAWRLENHTAQQHLVSLSLDTHHLLDHGHWVYDGPLAYEASVEPGDRVLLEARLVPISAGLLPLPRLTVSSLQHESFPMETMPTPPVLVLDS